MVSHRSELAESARNAQTISRTTRANAKAESIMLSTAVDTVVDTGAILPHIRHASAHKWGLGGPFGMRYEGVREMKMPILRTSLDTLLLF